MDPFEKHDPTSEELPDLTSLWVSIDPPDGHPNPRGHEIIAEALADTIRVNALAGEQASLAWVVAHFTPFLRLQAGYRIQGGMRRHHDPDDIVDEVWMIVLPRLAELQERDGHCTPVLMKFLATTLLHRVNNHLTRYLRAETQSLQPASVSGASETHSRPTW